MALPGIRVIYRRTNTAPNPQDLSAFGVVMGYSSLGTPNVVATLGSLAGCAAYGFGEGIEHAAEIGLNAGWPVYFCPVTGAPQAPGAVTKIPAGAGVPTYVGGYVKLAGADKEGDIGFQSLVPGVTLSCAVGANSATVTGSVGAWVVALTCPAAASSLFETFWNGVDAGATAARALVSAKFWGTKASNANSTPITSTILDNGAITLTAPAAGYTYKLTTGISQAHAASYATKALTIALGCDANTEPTGIASTSVADINAITGKVVAAPVGTGTGVLGILPTGFTALAFGSTAALTAAGTGNDDYNFLITCATAGTIGGSPAPAITWSADNGALTSSRALVPGTGIVALRDGFLDTGISITLTGALQVGDVWTLSVAKPLVAFADVLTALNAVIADTSRQKGYATSPTIVSRTQAQQLDTIHQAAATTAYLRGYYNTRDIGDGVMGETEAQWINANNAEWSGFVSANGLVRISAGHFSHISGYSERVYTRPDILLVTGRKSLLAMHQSLAETAMGPLPRIRYLVDPVSGVVTDPGIKHDEEKMPGLDDERFITTRTFAVKGSGEQYITRSPTMADPSDAGHALIMYVDVLMEAARTAAVAAFPYIEKPAEGIAVAESAQVPKGAISQADADAISTEVGGAVDALLTKLKSDNLPSASPLAPGERTITVLRNHPYITDKELRMELRVLPLGYNETIIIGVTLELP